MQLDDARSLIAAAGNLAPELQAAGRRRVAERIAAEGVVDLAAGRVYRFKHGWIPLTHAAALQQAHGNHAKAREAMARHHGAGWDRAARPKVRTSERTLTSRQPASGRDKVAKGFVPQAKPAALGSIGGGDLRRSPHIAADKLAGGKVRLRDTQTGHSIQLNEGHTASFHAQGHTVTAVHADHFTTRNDYGTTGRYGKDGRAVARTRAEISTVATERAQGVAQDRHRRLEAERVGKEERTVEQYAAGFSDSALAARLADPSGLSARVHAALKAEQRRRKAQK